MNSAYTILNDSDSLISCPSNHLYLHSFHCTKYKDDKVIDSKGNILVAVGSSYMLLVLVKFKHINTILFTHLIELVRVRRNLSILFSKETI